MFKSSLEDLMNINADKYTMRINNKINQAVILFPCKKDDIRKRRTIFRPKREPTENDYIFNNIFQ
jgi:hypothetical protein